MAREHLRHSQPIYKAHFDRKVKVRSVELGDEAVILLPTESNKSLMQWKCPYEVVEKVGLNHYRIKIGDNNKLTWKHGRRI